MAFKEISPYGLQGNFFEMFDNDWALVTAGSEADHNTMTISWGGVGILWNMPVATVYVRPARYTHEFLERETHFSIAFFGAGNQRKALGLLGAKSGRDGDKIAESGLSVQMFGTVPAFAEAELVLVCRKVYRQQIESGNILDQNVRENFYAGIDIHTVYSGEIEKVYIKA